MELLSLILEKSVIDDKKITITKIATIGFIKIIFLWYKRMPPKASSRPISRNMDVYGNR